MIPEIRTLADGEKISEPGIYRISLDVHHDQPCVGPSVTSGVLRTMELDTPADVWAFHKLNPDRWEKPQTTALRLGRAMAAYVEGNIEELEKHFATLPADKPRRPTPAQIKAYEEGRATEAGTESVEFWAAVDADARDYVTDIEWTMLKDMGRVLASDPMAAAAMGGIPEVTIAWLDDRTGLWCLSRPDTINFDGTVTDFKKMSSQGGSFNHRLVDRRITDHGYDMQLAFAAEGMEQVGLEWPGLAVIIAQSDKPPHSVIPRVIEEHDLRKAQWRNHRSIFRFRECLESGDWPGPGDDIQAYQRPDWQLEMLISQMNTEGTYR